MNIRQSVECVVLVHLCKKTVAVAMAYSALESGDVLFALLAFEAAVFGGALVDTTGLCTNK